MIANSSVKILAELGSLRLTGRWLNKQEYINLEFKLNKQHRHNTLSTTKDESALQLTLDRHDYM